MRIDTHQHYWRYTSDEYEWIDDRMSVIRRDCLPAEAAREMAAIGFDAAIAVQARQSLEETHALLAMADAHPFIAGVVGWVDLRSPAIESDLEAVAAHSKLVGVRHVVQGEPDDFLYDERFRRGISKLAAFNLTYDVLIYERQFPAAIDFIAAFPKQPFVLDHLGKPDIRAGNRDAWAKQMRELARHPNVCCKLSGLVTEAEWSAWTPEGLRPYLDVALEAFGPDRLMIGSDWPVCTVAGSYARVMAVVLDWMRAWSAHERDAVLGGTAERFWSLPRR